MMVGKADDGTFREIPIADVMAEFHDGPHATPKPANSGPVFLGIKNITPDGRLNLSTIRHIEESDFARWTRRVMPQPDDIVFTYEATLHRYALIPAGFRGCLGRRLALIRPCRDVADPRFLHLLLRGPEWRRTVEDRVISGATVDRVPLIDFPTFPISIPALHVQQRIAAVLAAFDELIEINERRIELLEELARSLYREWFVRFRFPGHLQTSLVEGELGPIPEGWRVLPLGDICSTIGAGTTPRRSDPSNWDEGTISWFKTGELRDGPLVDSVERVVRKPNVRLFEPPMILMAIYGSPTVGRLGWVTRTCSCNQAALALRARDAAVRQDWLWFQLQALRSHFNLLSHGAAQQNISKEKVVNTVVAVPPRDLLSRFAEQAGTWRQLSHELRFVNERLAATRDLILPRLVTGRLDISDIDLGELLPAEAV
jgi:type I restriction enzyme S subunit